MNDAATATAPSTKTIVFCEPPYVFWDRSLDGLRKGEETIPGMGMLILAAVARQKGYRVHLIDAKEQGRALEDVSAEIAALKPDYLGLSATTISVTNAARIAARVKEMLPGVVTIVGGAHVSAIPERTMEAFPSLTTASAARASIRCSTCSRGWRPAPPSTASPASPTVATENPRQPARTVHRRPRRTSASRLGPAARLPAPLPAHAFSYPEVAGGVPDHVAGLPVLVQLLDRSTSGKKGRLHSIDYIVELCRHWRAWACGTSCSSTTCSRSSASAWWRCATRSSTNGFRFTWSCTSHPNLLDLATMKLMKKAGCWQIAYGIESGSPRVLNVVKHEVKIPRMRETLRLTRAGRHPPKGYVMLGHPTEGLDSLAETLEFLKVVELDMCQITKFTPYPGTPAYPTILKHGTFTENWEQMNAMNFVFVPNGLTERGA